jgi:predicted alpha/beta hydrolase family esterase
LDPIGSRPSFKEFTIPGKPRPKEIQTAKIPEHESPPIHTVTVWDQFAAKAKAKEIVIVAHSAGGSVYNRVING